MTENERKVAWETYKKTGSQEIREQLILEYASLVKIVAGRLSMYLGFTVEYEDLTSYGIFGLIDAIDKFSLTKDVKFETYASLRIRGEILDQIRKCDWIPRTIRQRQKQIEAAIKEVENKTGRAATDTEVAAQLGITDEDYLKMQNQVKVTNLVSLNEFLEAGSDVAEDPNNQKPFMMPEEASEKAEMKKMLAQAIDTLTEKERQMILLYYYEDLTLKEIGQVMEVSEGRVSQLHSRALQKLKAQLGEYYGILTAVS